MSLTSFFASLAFLLSAVAYIPYLLAIRESRVKPTLSSWISWGLLDAVVLFGMIASHTMAWQLVAYVFGVTSVVGYSVWKGAAMNWTWLDSFCLGAVIVAIVVWHLTDNPVIAIILSLVAMAIGTIPFFRNLWRHPENEKLLPWCLFLAGGVCGNLAVVNWNIAGAGAPVENFVAQVITVLLLLRKFTKGRVIA